MPDFTVKAASVKRRLEDKGRGEKQVISLTLLRPSDGAVVDAEWFTASSTQLPEVGSQQAFEATYNEQYKRWDVKRPQRQGGSGFRPPDPERSRRIERQHSQSAAVAYAGIMQAEGKLPEDFGPEQLRILIDWFAQDVNE